jgi:hypothetical protein
VHTGKSLQESLRDDAVDRPLVGERDGERRLEALPEGRPADSAEEGVVVGDRLDELCLARLDSPLFGQRVLAVEGAFDLLGESASAPGGREDAQAVRGELPVADLGEPVEVRAAQSLTDGLGDLGPVGRVEDPAQHRRDQGVDLLDAVGLPLESLDPPLGLPPGRAVAHVHEH